jgi:methyltransferase (TIGR00027 family)
LKPGQPSRTAISAAVHRAVHQAESPLVFHDPLARAVLEPEWDEAAELLGRRPIRALLVARHRLAEDSLAAAVARGVTQYVLLGAGLDTFAWRNPYPALRVFEVDHPATQGWKRAQMAQLADPPNLTFVAADFEREPLIETLTAAGFDPARPSVIAWLGVTPYLTREAVLTTFAALASMGGGTEVVFDYGLPPEGFPSAIRAAYDRRGAQLAQEGEPWLSFFDSDELAGELARLGFGEIEALDEDAINRRYFEGRADGLKVVTGRVMRARKV